MLIFLFSNFYRSCNGITDINRFDKFKILRKIQCIISWKAAANARRNKRGCEHTMS